MENLPIASMTGMIEQMKQNVQTIQLAMKQVMKDGEHYGTIPGCGPKKCLMKPGADILCFIFRLRPSFKVEERQLEGAHRDFRLICYLHNQAGDVVAEGVGSCSTMESKYRYRKGAGEDTGKSVPKEYWNGRDQELLGGQGFMAKKDDSGAWKIFTRVDKAENPDIADQYNTVLKIGKKRAYVDATITATACSDMFTQDLDEGFIQEAEARVVVVENKPEPEPKQIAASDLVYTYEISKVKEEDLAKVWKYLRDNGAEQFDIDVWKSQKPLAKLDKYLVKEADVTDSTENVAA